MPSAKTVAKAALLVGTLDITAAFIQVYSRTGKSPFQPILAFIAKALVGKDTTMGPGALTAIGLLLHYFIAAGFTLLFFLTVAKLRWAKRNWLAAGFLYGLFIWAVMNLLVLPVTNTRKFPDFSKDLSNMALAAGILIICIGLPLAFINSRHNEVVRRTFQ